MPMIRLAIQQPDTLLAVEQWAAMARAIGMDDTTPVVATSSSQLVASESLDDLQVDL